MFTEATMTHSVWIVDEPDGKHRKAPGDRLTLCPGEVRVRIAASGVNPLDTKIRGGKADHARQSLPAVLGLDMAGVVDEIGPGVNSFKVGDEVYGMVGGVGGLQGTLAESMTCDSRLIARKPTNLSMRQAAALPLSVITSWEALIDKAKVDAGQKVLIHAGAGGVGHIAIQIARSFGAEVFATVSPEKATVVVSLGATPVDYHALTAEEYVEKFTQGKGFDIIFDTVGGGTLDQSFTAVKRYTGHVVSALGWGSHSLAPLSLRGATYSGVFTLLPLLTGDGREHHGEILRRASSLAEAGTLTPLLNARRYSNAEIEAAYADVAASSVGKTVIEF
jgi:NADPH2:quinone reductase